MTETADVISESLIRQYDVSGPRYTSYPTADRFVETFTAQDYVRALEMRCCDAAALPLSLYVHIPFCDSLCYFCACNKIITRHHDRTADYLRYLSLEADLHTHCMGLGQMVSQVHLGGGSPTFLSDDELRQLVDMLRCHFSWAAKGEYSIEIDPRAVDAARLDVLADLGFNRLSFGVQDFDVTVQKAVHRIQPAKQVFAVVEAARQQHFKSINVDLIYGLPRQTPESFAHTLALIIHLRPDRIALYAYAHLPDRFKHQRKILSEDIPQAATKVTLLAQSMAALLKAGYVYIGMDHFALPDDSLAVAKREGRLHRNFQGYSAQPHGDLVGLGVSSIGRVGATYSQNAKTMEAYCKSLDQSQFPVVRGLALSCDDRVRRAVIMALMCQGRLSFSSIELAYLIDFKSYFAMELSLLQEMVDHGLVTCNAMGIEVTAKGWFFVRAIAMVFDRYLQTNRTGARFSKIL